MKRISLLMTSILCLQAGGAFAATQGTLGATSTGSVDISVTKPSRARISNLNDLTLASWVDGDGNQTLTDDVCIYSTSASGAYTVLATGDGASNAFTLTDGSATLPYSVSWNDGGVGSLSNTGTALTTAVTSGTFNNASGDSSTCAGTSPGNTARLIVDITEADLDQVYAAVYTGTLTLVVTPD
ncbi:MAG: hypothetical protein IPP74_00955 [Alphaproteobacteria bacterium]|nr:hypothetical protein [Alphaproteobacteria bacterium]